MHTYKTFIFCSTTALSTISRRMIIAYTANVHIAVAYIFLIKESSTGEESSDPSLLPLEYSGTVRREYTNPKVEILHVPNMYAVSGNQCTCLTELQY